jgi:hypothetical protein
LVPPDAFNSRAVPPQIGEFDVIIVVEKQSLNFIRNASKIP